MSRDDCGHETSPKSPGHEAGGRIGLILGTLTLAFSLDPRAIDMPSKTTAERFSGCLDSVDRYVRAGSNPRAGEIMKAEIRSIARSVSLMQLSGEEKARTFLRPMETELVRRYGSQYGRKLYWAFVDSFWLQSWSWSPLALPQEGRCLELVP